MTKKITKRRVDAAPSGSTIWDSELKGFGLRTSAKGVKSYVLKYRHRSMQRWLTIGRHGMPWTPDTARNEARRLFGLIIDGHDPAKERSDSKLAETFAEFSIRYLDEYARKYRKPSTIAEEERLLKQIILPVLGKWKLREIAGDDIKRLHLDLKKTPYQANRVLALLSHMLNTAEDWELRDPNSNPCRRIKKYTEKPRERYLSSVELRRLGRALRVAERAGKSPYAVAAIRLLMFTGARLSEILTLQWEFVDMQAGLIRLPDSKTGAKTIALPPPALEILKNLDRQDGNPYVICGHSEGMHLVNLQKPWFRVRKAALISDVRLHDLRHTFASVGASGGMSLPIIGALLGHTQTQTTHRYAHLADDPRQAAAHTIAAKLEASLSGKTGSVVELRAGIFR